MAILLALVPQIFAVVRFADQAEHRAGGGDANPDCSGDQFAERRPCGDASAGDAEMRLFVIVDPLFDGRAPVGIPAQCLL